MSSNIISLINYKMGNLKSVNNAFKFLGLDVEITNDKDHLKNSCGIVLPGVGAFGDVMKNLHSLDLIDTIKQQISDGKPYLGICLGYQILFEDSEEDPDIPGLNIFKGHNVKFKKSDLKVPHIGWNQINIKKDSFALKSISDNEFYYFVHSYYPVPENKAIIATETEYGDTFASSVQKDNIYACQFHPEKSQDSGLQIIKNFGDYCVNNSGN
jgi:glutamine amidotransferase